MFFLLKCLTVPPGAHSRHPWLPQNIVDAPCSTPSSFSTFLNRTVILIASTSAKNFASTELKLIHFWRLMVAANMALPYKISFPNWLFLPISNWYSQLVSTFKLRWSCCSGFSTNLLVFVRFRYFRTLLAVSMCDILDSFAYDDKMLAARARSGPFCCYVHELPQCIAINSAQVLSKCFRVSTFLGSPFVDWAT